MYISRLDIPEPQRQGAVRLLQACLSDALDLEAQLKHAHWNVRGRTFFQLHRLFDEIHGEVEASVDTLAERITALGGTADGRVQSTAQATTLDEYPLSASQADGHLAAVAAALGQFGKGVRAAIEPATDLPDPGTADALTGISRETDKQLWLVEAHLACEADPSDGR